MKTFFSALVLLVASSGHTMVHAQSTYNWTSIGHNTPYTHENSEYVTSESPDSPSTGSLSWSAPPYSVAASSTAGLGAVVATANATSVGYGNLGHFINSTYVDWLTLSHPDLMGQAGQVQVSFYYENTFVTSASGSGQANTRSTWYAYGDDATSEVHETHNGGEFSADYKYAFIDDASGVSQHPLSVDEHYLTLTLNFIWGQPMRVGLGLTSSGQAVDDGAYEVTHAAYWAGILGATGGGSAVLDYTLTSASGIDYSQSFIPQVPEPDSFVLLSCGLVALGMRQLMRRRHLRNI